MDFGIPVAFPLRHRCSNRLLSNATGLNKRQLSFVMLPLFVALALDYFTLLDHQHFQYYDVPIEVSSHVH